jgi:hypothetical protein
MALRILLLEKDYDNFVAISKTLDPNKTNTIVRVTTPEEALAELEGDQPDFDQIHLWGMRHSRDDALEVLRLRQPA